MTFKVQSILVRLFSRIVSVSVCLCAFSIFLPAQFSTPEWSESAEEECPSEEDRENSEEELVVRLSERDRSRPRRCVRFCRAEETPERLRRYPSYATFFPAIVGHQLANGLCAPLRI
jgi:hypothetical protein